MNEAMYRQRIIDRYKQPRRYGEVEGETHTAHVYNPYCGDDITVHLRVGDRVEKAGFTGKACAICTASADLLAEHVEEKTPKEAEDLKKEEVTSLLAIPISPVRLKCALLPLEAVHKALYVNNQ